MRTLSAFLLAAACSVAGCSGYATKPASKAPPLAAPAPTQYARPCAGIAPQPAQAFECDRRSILAMAGEYRVRFAFDETAALAPGYAPHAQQRSGGTELVEVVADDGEYIALQHILVMGKDHIVVKHWRQDWRYQPREVLRFRGHGRFETETLDPVAVAGAWSQTVYEVDDAPRYAGIGRWTHADGVDAWESDRSLRPLPRREYSKRSDYHALDVVNRHTLTPAGWVHEQDNTKLVLDAAGGARALAREHGINSYTRIADYDFGAGRDYMQRTGAYWTGVREAWAAAIAAHPRFTTAPEPNGEPRIEKFLDAGERAGKGETVTPAEIRALVDAHLTATP